MPQRVRARVLSEPRRLAEVLAELEGLLGGRVDDAHLERLALYGSRVLDANRRVNLTGAKSPPAIAQHILDSLTVVPYVREPLIDVGSGAGFPAIPLAIATGVPVTLVEATAKKARFLESVLHELGLAGEVVVERAEAAAHEERWRERFLTGTARAVASAATAAELVLPFLAVGGLAVLQRGRLEERERSALADASLMLGGELEGMAVAGSGREIVLLRKRKPTPQRFPRRAGIPAKRPLMGAFHGKQ